MTDLVNASPLIILLGLVALAWFTNSKLLKLAAAGYFFLYPVIIGKTVLPSNLDQATNFVANTVSYWLTEALNALVEYIKQKLNLI